MRTFPNTDAVTYFARKIFPLIKARKRDATFLIVGNQPTRRVRSLHDGKSITVTGLVDSVVPYLANAAVLVAPMRVSAGVQNKILEALAVGTPVVTTSIGAEGLDGGVIQIADTPEEFARATLLLMEHEGKRREASIAGRKWVQEHYSWDQALRRLNSLLGQPVEQDVEHDLGCR
jgi:glycosyltransferase involved in cell wall biosynthesis